MYFVFLENSSDFTSSSLNLEAIDSFQRVLIHFCKELVRRNHRVTFFNSTSINKSEDGIDWMHFSEISNFSNFLNTASAADTDICWEVIDLVNE